MKWIILPIFWLLFAIGALVADDLMPLSDEFDEPGTISRWRNISETEGWNANQLELWNIDSSTAGHMYMMPYTSGWYAEYRGVLVYKEVEGNFIVTMRMRVGGRANIANPPNRQYSLAGIFVHRPIPSRVHSAPVPFPVGKPTVPPPALGSPGHYVTDWLPGQENYVFLSFGCANTPGVRQYEVKNTVGSDSQLYFASRGVMDTGWVTLQTVIVGNTAVTLRRHERSDGFVGPWIVENRYTTGGTGLQRLASFDHDNNPATPHRYQVGVTTYTNYEYMDTFPFNGVDGMFRQNYTVISAANGFTPTPDLVAEVDYVRFVRPNPALTETMLQALSLDFNNRFQANIVTTPLRTLSSQTVPAAISAASYLGDVPNIAAAAAPEDWRQATFQGNANLPGAQLAADFDGDGLSNLIEYALGTNALLPEPDPAAAGLRLAPGADLRFAPNDRAGSRVSLRLEASADLGTGTWDSIASRAAGSSAWLAETEGATVQVNAAGAVTVLDTTELDPATESRYFRLHAESAF